ncbi:hypothetical protein [Pseudomonas sp. CFBP 13719]|uniref:hypothetical protein n=1 Tax=Pseudomonas sp. CFBP 13719 TaxID=2775303 RepID=UPI00177B12C4|nr:hypothetical protein [Pseudomonas putida]MBD8681430.1 hypothetical protein [Pseudomonas sp. CFBP 13719]
MSTLFESFKQLLRDRIEATLGPNPLNEIQSVDVLLVLDTSPAKIGSIKSIAKAYFELANSRTDLIEFAKTGLDMFWAPTASMEHPYGAAKVLGYHPSIVSSPNGFSVFMGFPQEDQSRLMALARERNPKAYAGTMARLMSAGTLNAFHALSTLNADDLALFNQPEFKQVLMDIVQSKDGSLATSARNKHSIAEVLWLNGHRALAKELMQAQKPTPGQPQQDLVVSLQMALQSAFLTKEDTHPDKIIEMATDLYDVGEQSSVYDQALSSFIKSPLADASRLGSMLLDRARQAHELGEIERIRAWLPDYLSQPNDEIKNIHGSPFLWAVLALNPTWIAGMKKFSESMADARFLRASVIFTDPQSWRELVELSAAKGSEMFWCLAKLDPEVVNELKLGPTVVSMFLDSVEQGREQLSTLGTDQSKVWEKARKATTTLAYNLGSYCRQEKNAQEIDAVFEVLGQAEYRKAFLEPLPRFPRLLERLPAHEMDNLIGGDLGL